MAGIVFLLVGGGIFARDREDPAPTGGQCGDCDDWRCDERARPLAICREGGTFAGQWGAMGMDGLAGIVFGVVGGGIFARNREDPAPTVGGGRGDCDDRHCGERARLLAICREGGTFAGQ